MLPGHLEPWCRAHFRPLAASPAWPLTLPASLCPPSLQRPRQLLPDGPRLRAPGAGEGTQGKGKGVALLEGPLSTWFSKSSTLFEIFHMPQIYMKIPIQNVI